MNSPDAMNSDEMPHSQLDSLNTAFRDGLLDCLEECARGRRGLFVAYEHLGDEDERGWPEADRLRQLAAALQALSAQAGERNALCEEFLDLCTIHGEYDPGESRLARAFMSRIEKNEVGTPTESGPKPW